MLLDRTWLVPHLPTLIIDERRGHDTPMILALSEAAERLRVLAPQAIVAVSARWNAAGPFLVDAGTTHRTLTDYSGFGVEVRYDCTGYPKLARALVDAGQQAGVRVGAATRGVDSGVAVPLHFMARSRDIPVVPLSVAVAPYGECLRWGAVLRRALAAWPERVAFIVGGLLSFNLHAWTLRRDVPEGTELDERMLAALAAGHWDRIEAGEERAVASEVHEAGHRHLEVLRGFLGQDVPGQVLCYEPSPGAGAALVEFAVPEVARTAPAPRRSEEAAS